jgi:hypothetical protein
LVSVLLLFLVTGMSLVSFLLLILVKRMALISVFVAVPGDKNVIGICFCCCSW